MKSLVENTQTGKRVKKHVRFRYLIAAVVALAGVAVMAYPEVENLFYDRQIASYKHEFSAKYPQVGDQVKPNEELYQFLKSENERLFQTGQSALVDAFSYQRAGIDLSAYGIQDDCIGFISLPTINMELPIFLGANRENMRKGAVHLTQTSYPIGGENTNTVIAAHRGGTLKMFRNIHEIKIGDEITLTNFRETLVYRAAEIRIIKPNEIDKVMIQEGRELLTLISCNPLGKNYQRYVLYCERVFPVPPVD
ncbi:MAG: class C sortase [Propionibacteriaceae bacterium]|nr:class C sortase [Propionibacteriaceae bacterium]